MIEIKGFDNYFIDEFGSVFSKKSGSLRKMKTHVDSQGYLSLRLSRNGKTKLIRVHRLVAENYYSYRDECINHKDGNKLNNHYSNLEWTSLAKNNKHAYENRLNHKQRIPNILVSIIKRLYLDYNFTPSEIRSVTGANINIIKSILYSGAYKSHYYGKHKESL